MNSEMQNDKYLTVLRSHLGTLTAAERKRSFARSPHTSATRPGSPAPPSRASFSGWDLPKIWRHSTAMGCSCAGLAAAFRPCCCCVLHCGLPQRASPAFSCFFAAFSDTRSEPDLSLSLWPSRSFLLTPAHGFRMAGWLQWERSNTAYRHRPTRFLAYGSSRWDSSLEA